MKSETKFAAVASTALALSLAAAAANADVVLQRALIGNHAEDTLAIHAGQNIQPQLCQDDVGIVVCRRRI